MLKNVVLSLLLIIGSASLAQAQTADLGPDGPASLLATYEAFAAAQNDRDLDRVGQFFIDGPEFLWVSDGQSFWGREAVLARMGRFQGADIWRVLPDLDTARIVPLSQDSAFLHLSLVLEIGSDPRPNRLGFLVTILFVKQESAPWRIAALLTTREKNQ